MTPVSPTFTGPLPRLEVNLSICEIGNPCRPSQPAREETAQQPKLNARPGYVCRIHRIRRFFEELGWVE